MKKDLEQKEEKQAPKVVYKMLRNVRHNGKDYAKDSEVEETDEAFADLKAANHVEQAVGSGAPQASVEVGQAIETGKLPPVDDSGGAPVDDSGGAPVATGESADSDSKPARRR